MHSSYRGERVCGVRLNKFTVSKVYGRDIVAVGVIQERSSLGEPVESESESGYLFCNFIFGVFRVMATQS